MHADKRLLHSLPVLVDLIAILAIIFGLNTLSEPLETPAGWNAFWLAFFYLVFCLGVYLIRKLDSIPNNGEWTPPGWIMQPKSRAGLAIFFGLLMVTTLAYQLGYFASLLDIRTAFMEEGNSMAFFVFAPGAWISFSMLYILVLAFPVNANVKPQSVRYATFSFLGLLGVQGMVLFSVAQAHAWVSQIGDVHAVFLFILAFLTLLLSFVPPRMMYQDKEPDLPGWISLLLLLLVATMWVVFAPL